MELKQVLLLSIPFLASVDMDNGMGWICARVYVLVVRPSYVVINNIYRQARCRLRRDVLETDNRVDRLFTFEKYTSSQTVVRHPKSVTI